MARSPEEGSPSFLEVSIERLGALGEGVAHHQGRVLFVPGAFPLERVRVRLLPAGKVQRAELVEVLTPSPERRASACPASDRCGGCDWLELSEGAQQFAKQERTLASLAQAGLVPPAFDVLPLKVAPVHLAYRRRAVLHFGQGKLGYHGKRSHDPVAIDACAALLPALSPLPAQLSPLLKPLSQECEAVHLLAEKEAVSFAVFLKGKVSARAVDACERAVRTLKLEGAVLVPQEGSPRVLGKPVLRVENALCPEVPLYLRPDAFSQAHAAGNEGLVSAALNLLQPSIGARALELYSGNGNFTFALAQKVTSVVAVESSPVSMELARRSAREGKVDSVRWIQGDAAQVCQSLLKEKAFFDFLLVDPPRSGAPGLASWAQGLHVQRVVYVACDVDSLARDAAQLLRAGFAPKALQVVEMFPQTRHIEAVMSFER